MQIWLKLRRWQWCFGASLGLLVLASSGRGLQLPLPSMLGGDLIANPLALLLPAAWWMLLAHALSQVIHGLNKRRSGQCVILMQGCCLLSAA